MMALNKNGNSNHNGYGNGFSSKLRIPGIYEEKSDNSNGSFEIKQTPDKNRRKTHTYHNDPDTDEPVNSEGDVIAKHVNIWSLKYIIYRMQSIYLNIIYRHDLL